MLGAPETRLSGPGGPGWRGGAHRALGAGGDRAAVRALAPLPIGGVRSPGVAPAAGPTPGEDGAAIATRAGERGPQSRGALPRADEVVGGVVDLCPSGRRGADEQCSGARPAPGSAVAEGELWLG